MRYASFVHGGRFHRTVSGKSFSAGRSVICDRALSSGTFWSEWVPECHQWVLWPGAGWHGLAVRWVSPETAGQAAADYCRHLMRYVGCRHIAFRLPEPRARRG